MKYDRELDAAIDTVTTTITTKATDTPLSKDICNLHKDIDAAESILIILLRVKATLNKIEADASNERVARPGLN